uniref:Uncharacterized protein n=1 Tax=viral metagenome TaxID=1070528 RepID=A0A2V0RAV1_9ZZZZ
MSVAARTKVYATEVAKTALNAFEKQARGNLKAPNGDENVRVYTARGGSAVTLKNATTSAAIVYDPEASLRNGQLAVHVYERNAAGDVSDVKRVTLGRATEEFLSAGVLSSGLKAFNSSGVDVIGGTQSAAVLTSVPRDIGTITTTELANFCSNHERDLASGVVSREDGTLTMTMTEHFGKKMALTRSNTQGNVVSRTWDDGIGSRRTTVGSTLSFTENTDVGSNLSPAFTSGQAGLTDITTILGDDTLLIVDSSRLDEDKNPLTLACYQASVDVYMQIQSPQLSGGAGTTDSDQFLQFKIFALDAADNVIAERQVNRRAELNHNNSLSVTLNGTVTSTTNPIARVVVAAISMSGDLTTLTLNAGQTSTVLRAYEETADIAARPVHVCVFEGLNSGATLNIGSTAVLTGVPDSANVFIAAANAEEDEVYDSNSVYMFLKSMSRVLPRAFTLGGHGVVEKKMSAMYGDDTVTIAFKAMSFSDVASAAKKIGEAAKATAAEALELMKYAGPVMSTVGDVASMAPGRVGQAGMLLSDIGHRIA